MGTIFQGFHLGRGIGNPSHIGRIRLHIHIERWLELAQFIRKSLHTLGTAIDHTRTSLHMIALGEDLREIVSHTVGNTTMLLFTQLCQLTTIALGILPYLRQPSLHFLAQRSQVGFIIEMLVYPNITTITRQPARSVPTVMTDIKRGITFRSLYRNRLLGSRISIIHAPHLLTSLSLRQKGASY